MVHKSLEEALAKCPATRLGDGVRYKACVFSGGNPCQDISIAGKGAGLEGARSGLAGVYIGALRLVRPLYWVMENVAALLNRGMGQILREVAESGYDAEWDCIPASAIGAPHERDRVWVIAYANKKRRGRLVTSADISAYGQRRTYSPQDLQLIYESPYIDGHSWPKPLLRGMDDGVSHKLDKPRLSGLGNAIHPDIAEIIGKAIMRDYNHE